MKMRLTCTMCLSDTTTTSMATSIPTRATSTATRATSTATGATSTATSLLAANEANEANECDAGLCYNLQERTERAKKPNAPPKNRYIHVTAKDSDSDSDNAESNTKSNAESNTKSNAESSAESCERPRRSQQPTKLLPIPDMNNVRFCRVCGDFLPLSKFPAGFRRYTCRVHLYQRTGPSAQDGRRRRPCS